MKRLNRSFTTREKVLLLVLALILIALCYYQFIYKYVNNAVEANNMQIEDLEIGVSTAEAQLQAYQQTEARLASIQEADIVGSMPSYNNSDKEITLLNDIFAKATEYDVSFGELTREGNLIRRPFSVSFKTDSYTAARTIISNLCNSEYRCIITDMTMKSAEDKKGNTVITVRATAAFYETLVDGQADAALPEDTTQSN